MIENNINEQIIMNFSEIHTSKELHKYLKKELNFPDFYGMNWDAFWDAITGLVELPENLVIVGWDNLIKTIPEDAKNFKELMERSNRVRLCKCTIKYLDL